MKYSYQGYGPNNPNSSYYGYRYPMNSAAATAIVMMPYPAEKQWNDFGTTRYAFLLGKRAATCDAYPNTYALIGGILEAGKENLETTMTRELDEEFGINPNNFPNMQMVMAASYSDPETDPRIHMINQTFLVDLAHNVKDIDMNELKSRIKMNDEHSAYDWYDQDEIMEMPLAFNHKQIFAENYDLFPTYYTAQVRRTNGGRHV